MLKKWILFFSGILLVFGLSAFSTSLPKYQGVRPSPSQRDNPDTEAQLPSFSPADKCCDREINAQRDRDPHGMSPQEVRALVQKIVKRPQPTPPKPPTDGDGSR